MDYTNYVRFQYVEKGCESRFGKEKNEKIHINIRYFYGNRIVSKWL